MNKIQWKRKNLKRLQEHFKNLNKGLAIFRGRIREYNPNIGTNKDSWYFSIAKDFLNTTKRDIHECKMEYYMESRGWEYVTPLKKTLRELFGEEMINKY